MTLHYRFIQQAVVDLNHLCVEDYETKKSYTYGQMLEYSMALSRVLPSYIKEDQLVGIALPVSSFHIMVKLAVLMIGKKIPVILNYATGLERNIEYARKKCNLSKVISSRIFYKTLGITSDIEGTIFIEDLILDIQKELGYLRDKVNFSDEKDILSYIDVGSDDDVAVMLFTSGSEKDPKVVPLTHRNILYNIDILVKLVALRRDDVFAAVLPYFHVFGMNTSLWLAVNVGASIIAHPNPLNIQSIIESFSKCKVTVLLGIPSFFHAYYFKAQKSDFDNLRILIAGGDKLPVDLYERYKKKFGKIIVEGYGATELSPVISLNPMDNPKIGSMGKVLPNLEYKIISLTTGKEVNVGEEGKLFIKGDSVMKGYYNDPETTATVLKDGWYDTGDIVVEDKEGFIFYKGRFKRFVKIAGEMISPIFIESVIEKYIPSGVRCCVVSKHHAAKGAELVAVFDKDLDFTKLKRNLLSELKPIMIPKYLKVVDELPLSGLGKVDFRRIETMVQSEEEGLF